jgi:hypothetical protein
VLALAGEAQACVCENAPIEERLDRADAAVVGRIVDERKGAVGGAQQILLTIDVEQRVKGDVPRPLVVRSPSGTDCDLSVPRSETIGLLLTRAPDGALLASACSVVGAGELVVAGGEPRGGPIKVLIGVAILALVVLWSFRRLKHGSRPDLPGPPRP